MAATPPCAVAIFTLVAAPPSDVVIPRASGIGPLWRTWISEHTACEEGCMFRDIQIKGPFARWEHTHRFEPDGPSACYLEDRVEYALPLGALGKLSAGRFVRRKLDRLFAYRHDFTAAAFRE